MTCQQVQGHLAAARGEAPAECFRHLEECAECQRAEAARAGRWRALEELRPPDLPEGWAATVVARSSRRPGWRAWLFPTSDDLDRSSLPLAGLVGALAGAASAGLDLAWQERLTPAWLDRLGVPLGRLLGARVQPDCDLLVAGPAWLGLLVVLWLAWRALLPGQRGPLSSRQATGWAAFAGILPLALLLGSSVLLGYADWWSFADTPLAWRWLAILPGLAWGGLFLTRRLADMPTAANSFYLCVGAAALLHQIVLHWERVRLELGLPSLYYLRFTLPPSVLLAWFTLLGLAAALSLVGLAELVSRRKPWLAGMALGLSLLCGVLSVSSLSSFGIFYTADAEVWASYPALPGRATALVLAPGLGPLPVAHPEGPDSEAGLRERVGEIQARAFFDLHRLTRLELARWEPTPGLAGALQQLAHMRPRRRGWWGTGPMGLAPLPAHPSFAAAAARAAALMPDNLEVRTWQRQCQDARASSVLTGRVVRVQAFETLVRLLPGTPEEARRLLDREPTYWGWTAVLATRVNMEGEFILRAVPGQYVVAVLAPGGAWRVTSPTPGVVTLREGQKLDLGTIRIEEAP